LYVRAYQTNEIYVITTSDNKISHEISNFTTFSWGALAFNLDGALLYHGVYDRYLAVIDTSDDRVISTTTVFHPFDFALSPDDTRLYVASSGRMRVVDTATRIEISLVSGFTHIERLAYSPHGPRLYAPGSHANNLKIVDTRTNLISKTLQNLQAAYHVAFHPTRPLAYVTMTSANSVAIIDTDKEEVLNIMEGFAQPKSIAIDPSGSFALVSNFTANTVFVVQL
jgi:DNA-binding beta-propeller fold protein YncE